MNSPGSLFLRALLIAGVRGFLSVCLVVAARPVLAQPEPTNGPPADFMARLGDEGTNRSQMAEIFMHLTDVLGPRLTASPNCLRANEWTRDKLASWGLTNAHLEPWGPFGRGWSLRRFSAQLIAPQVIPLVAWPKAWSYGTPWPVVGELVYLEANTEEDLEKYKGKLQGRIVLVSEPREIKVRFEPVARRLDETNLLRLANAGPPAPRRRRPERPPEPRPSPAPEKATNAPPAEAASTNAPPPRPERPRRIGDSQRLRFAVQEGAALTASVSSSGDGGAVWVSNATVVPPVGEETNQTYRSMHSWATNAPAGPPQIVVAAEQYNRLVHMIQAGETLQMAVEVQTDFHDQDLMAYNTLAEIPGSDLDKEIVMLGAHLDSAPGGTGDADNAAGVAVCMEAVRLLTTLNLQPRRTIRIGLWTGEEQGLLGSRAYVAKHFGYYTNKTEVTPLRSPKDASQQAEEKSEGKPATRRQLVRHGDYKRFSAYYNLDNGAGRIRGIHLQGNEALRAIFRPWLEPLRDLGAETITLANTGGTDHQAFDAVGLPGFQFIQDPIEYWRGYHNTLDVRERAPVEDLQQAAIVMAAFVYQTAMLDEKLPRKPLEEEPRRGRGNR